MHGHTQACSKTVVVPSCYAQCVAILMLYVMQLMQALSRHWVERYGEENISHWYIEG